MKREIKSENRNKQWFDWECELLKKDRCICLNIFRRNKTQTSLSAYIKARNVYKNVCRQKKKHFLEKNKEILEESISSSKEFWKTLKKINFREVRQSNIECHEWFEYFKGLFSNKDIVGESEVQGDVQFDSNCEMATDILDIPITRDEITCAIQNLKNDKSPGMDGLISDILKYSVDAIVSYLELLFNNILKTSYFPKE